jgi:Ras-related protein Rab-2A
MSFDYAIKFILVGDTAVGKTSILNRFLTGSFDYNHEMTIGVEFGSKILTVNKQRIKLQVWDTAGQEEFRSITRSYYRSSAAALVVYDVSRRETFRSVRRWIEEVRN